MLYHVMGIKGVNRPVSERQLAADVGPDVDLRSDEVGVHIDPTVYIISLAGAKLNLGIPPMRRKCPVAKGIQPHGITEEGIIASF
jgi:hypothetical protein